MMKTLAMLVLVAACGDNLGASPADSMPDAPAGPPRAVVVSGDFMPGATGVMSRLDLEAMRVDQRVAPNSAVGNDPLLRKIGGELFVVNRNDGNNVTIVDATTFQVVEQLATGPGSNPQDIAVAAGKLFVPAFGTAGVVVLRRGSTDIATIDLASLDPDGKPNCISAYAVGPDVFVACELLDENFLPRGPGKVAVIDAATSTLRTTITLANANPFGVFEKLPDDILGGDLVIPSVTFGNFTVGCVERVSTGATPAANGCITTNDKMMGYVARLDIQPLEGVTMMWMAVSNGMFGPAARSRLWGYDLTTMSLWAAPISPETELLLDLAACPGDSLVVADQAMAANGLRVYVNGTETTPQPLAIGLKPGSNHGLVCY